MHLITGMHRSGTSLFARLVYDAGGNLGDSKTFYRSDKWNPDGYYEQVDVQQINMKLINGIWGKLAYLSLPSKQKILDRAKKHKSELVNLSKKYDDKIVKETRFCLTFPAWIFAGAIFDRVILCIREPMEVVLSLQQRNHITNSFALKLWCIHYERILRYLENIEYHILYYNQLISEYGCRSELYHAFKYLDLNPSDKKIDTMYSSIRFSSNKQQTVTAYPENVKTIWEKLLILHQEGNSKNL